ncbi:hypothetical protein MP228_011750 [Amoeboaphelidium protococcarum]|nr:hypothetical protein MP228_011750 [Amoeboaphelidium protococcarum]
MVGEMVKLAHAHLIPRALPAKLKESSVIWLFVNADNPEKLVMYFPRLGMKAGETKLQDFQPSMP